MFDRLPASLSRQLGLARGPRPDGAAPVPLRGPRDDPARQPLRSEGWSGQSLREAGAAAAADPLATAPGLLPVDGGDGDVAPVTRHDHNIAVQFTPPKGLHPGQIGTLVD